MGLTVAPLPDSAGSIFGAVLVPEQAMWPDLQLGEVDAGRDGPGGAQGFSFWR
jgi:hypothetical protein